MDSHLCCCRRSISRFPQTSSLAQSDKWTLGPEETLKVVDGCKRCHLIFLHAYNTSVSVRVRRTRRSGQLNSSKTSWKSSMAPSVISMMAWLHRLPWPSAAACMHKAISFLLKQGIFVKTQQLSWPFLRGTNLVQDLERLLHCILHFALSFNVKLLYQELEMLQRGVRQTNN